MNTRSVILLSISKTIKNRPSFLMKRSGMRNLPETGRSLTSFGMTTLNLKRKGHFRMKRSGMRNLPDRWEIPPCGNPLFPLFCLPKKVEQKRAAGNYRKLFPAGITISDLLGKSSLNKGLRQNPPVAGAIYFAEREISLKPGDPSLRSG